MSQRPGFPLLERIAEREYNGETLDSLIPRLIEKHGTLAGATRELGVARNTVRNWLLDNGYQMKMSRTIKVVKAVHRDR